MREKPNSELINNKCHNGGSCNVVSPSVDKPPTFYCQCTVGYQGSLCELPTPGNICEKSKFLPYPGLNGTQNDEIGMNKNGTQNGWHLVNATQHFLIGGLCQNSGICKLLVSETEYKCVCPEGYKGKHCQYLNHCHGNPCLNGARCISHNDSYYCECLAGLTGKNCEKDIDECDVTSNHSAPPCMNQGTCLNTVGSYKCLCPIAFIGERCEKRFYPCNPSPCQNRGMCHITGDFTYKCQCQPGFDGEDCENNVDECALGHKCQNGSTCLDRINSYTCQCSPQFKGTYCELDVDECLTMGPWHLCKNGGTCINTRGSYYCACVNGWTGPDCGENIDDCAIMASSLDGVQQTSVCMNGGTCHDRIGSYYCACPPGKTGLLCHLDDACAAQNPCAAGSICETNFINGDFVCSCPSGMEGTLCDMDVDECQMGSPCEHEGTCVNTLGSFECACKSGFSGPRCEINIDECSSYPCLNDGTCLDETDKFTCVCMPGYTGDRCEVNINECGENPCHNGGLCTDLIDGFFCTCPLGYEGKTCEKRVKNECQQAESPCSNGGICLSDSNNGQIIGYKCECLPGFSGNNCEKPINPCLSQNPCNNGGRCINLSKNQRTSDGLDYNGQNRLPYQCKCPSSFMGTHCEHYINYSRLPPFYSYDYDSKDCRNNNKGCLNEGKCQMVPLLTGNEMAHRCICSNGFTGKACEITINEKPRVIEACLKATLAENGIDSRYIDLNNLYYEEDEASSQGYNRLPSGRAPWSAAAIKTLAGPCHNGGTCINIKKENAFESNDIDYECVCPPGFTGPRCKQEIDECALVYPIYIYSRDNRNATSHTISHATNQTVIGPCLNGGICKDYVASYVCDCPKGWSGPRCQINEPDCTPTACLNNGKCIDGIGDYTCECKANYGGKHCEKYLISDSMMTCENFACLNRGTCYNAYDDSSESGRNKDIDGYYQNSLNSGIEKYSRVLLKCRCPPGFVGDRCETRIDPCNRESMAIVYGFRYINGKTEIDSKSSICANGGVCYSLAGSATYNSGSSSSKEVVVHDNQRAFRCECQPGWTGETCEIKMVTCATMMSLKSDHLPVCGNGGTCLDIKVTTPDPDYSSYYKCLCREGFKGSHCEIPIDECAILSPCLNGATCINSHNLHRFSKRTDNSNTNNGKRYVCECPPGFEGEHCQTNIDDCKHNPCKHGGICHDLINDFRCSCPPGTLGFLCETNINECQNVKCHHGGTCVDKIGSFQCICPPGFVGKTCEGDINECMGNPCDHIGTRDCIQLDNDYKCVCRPGFKGKQCQLKYDTCRTNKNPCLNGATCHTNAFDSKGFKCKCKPNFYGDICQNTVKSCQTHPCRPGEYCLDAGPLRRCFCDLDYSVEIIKDLDLEKKDIYAKDNDKNNANRCNFFANVRGTSKSPSTNPNSDTMKDISNDQQNININIQDRLIACQALGCTNPENMLGNGQCQQICNLPECDWDGRDCSLGLDPWAHCHKDSSKIKDNNVKFRNSDSCYKVYGNGVCDPECDNRGCLFDGFDCLENYTSSSDHERRSYDPIPPNPGDIGNEKSDSHGYASKGTLIIVLNTQITDNMTNLFDRGITLKNGDVEASIPNPLLKTLSDLLRANVRFKQDRWGNPMIFPTLLNPNNDRQKWSADRPEEKIIVGSKIFLEVDNSRCSVKEINYNDDDDRDKGECLANVNDAARFIAAKAARKILPPQLAALVSVRGEGDDNDEETSNDSGTGYKSRSASVNHLTYIFSIGTALLLVSLIVGVIYNSAQKRKRIGRGITWFPEGFSLTTPPMHSQNSQNRKKHKKQRLDNPYDYSFSQNYPNHEKEGYNYNYDYKQSQKRGIDRLERFESTHKIVMSEGEEDNNGGEYNGDIDGNSFDSSNGHWSPDSQFDGRKGPEGQEMKTKKDIASVVTTNLRGNFSTLATKNFYQTHETPVFLTARRAPYFNVDQNQCKIKDEENPLYPPGSYPHQIINSGLLTPPSPTTNLNASKTLKSSKLNKADEQYSGSRYLVLKDLSSTTNDKSVINFEARTEDTLENPLHLAARFARADSARFLLEAGADINSVDHLGRTPLHTAIASDATGVFHLLMRYHKSGLSLDSPCKDGTTPLILAARVCSNDSRIPSTLIDCNADLNATDDLGRTALHWAAAVNNYKTVSLLLKKGANPDAQDLKDETAIFLAAREGSYESAKILLIDHKANTDIANNVDILPLDVAKERLHSDICQLITHKRERNITTPYDNASPTSQSGKTGANNKSVLCSTKLYPILESASEEKATVVNINNSSGSKIGRKNSVTNGKRNSFNGKEIKEHIKNPLSKNNHQYNKSGNIVTTLPKTTELIMMPTENNKPLKNIDSSNAISALKNKNKNYNHVQTTLPRQHINYCNTVNDSSSPVNYYNVGEITPPPTHLNTNTHNSHNNLNNIKNMEIIITSNTNAIKCCSSLLTPEKSPHYNQPNSGVKIQYNNENIQQKSGSICDPANNHVENQNIDKMIQDEGGFRSIVNNYERSYMSDITLKQQQNSLYYDQEFKISSTPNPPIQSSNPPNSQYDNSHRAADNTLRLVNNSEKEGFVDYYPSYYHVNQLQQSLNQHPNYVNKGHFYNTNNINHNMGLLPFVSHYATNDSSSSREEHSSSNPASMMTSVFRKEGSDPSNYDQCYGQKRNNNPLFDSISTLTLTPPSHHTIINYENPNNLNSNDDNNNNIGQWESQGMNNAKDEYNKNRGFTNPNQQGLSQRDLMLVSYPTPSPESLLEKWSQPSLSPPTTGYPNEESNSTNSRLGDNFSEEDLLALDDLLWSSINNSPPTIDKNHNGVGDNGGKDLANSGHIGGRAGNSNQNYDTFGRKEAIYI
ncbi:neurogenic locus notch homolog protein 1-like isoform X2 [Gordionus sp. m RMFG-2023]